MIGKASVSEARISRVRILGAESERIPGTVVVQEGLYIAGSDGFYVSGIDGEYLSGVDKAIKISKTRAKILKNGNV